MATALADRTTDSVWMKDHCLRHCEGYQVYSPDGPLGYVDEVYLSPDGDRVNCLLVRGLRRRLVPAAEIEDIEPEADRLYVKGTGSARRDLGTSRAACRGRPLGASLAR